VESSGGRHSNLHRVTACHSAMPSLTIL
jgi:hypothetical protein